jgi:hypothetical protein
MTVQPNDVLSTAEFISKRTKYKDDYKQWIWKETVVAYLNVSPSILTLGMKTTARNFHRGL